MPDLIIDGRAVSVAKGTSVIEAAEKLGIMIPRFCWHPALGVAGACRMCAVMFLDGPVKGLNMSCMTPAADGMVVETGHPEAVAFRRHVIELLMVNHPHDCPVCDEGGQCLLQDETISGNHARRRFPGRKRTYLDQDLGPFIRHEMNRCIHCYRCARFYQEYCGYRDFGAMQNANRVYFGRFEPGALQNPFAGNLADLCPTGTLTDKTARYKSRRWDCERAPSVCPHCSLGCNTVAASRYREVARVEARENLLVNGFFLCDRGRFSHGFEASPERPRTAAIDGRPATPPEALCMAAGRLAETVVRHGPSAVAVAGSTRSTLETQAALILLARAAGWRTPAFFRTREEQAAMRAVLAGLSATRARSLAEISRADAVLCLGVSPLFDAPMLAISLRQATRAGRQVFVADPRPVTLPLPFVHLPAHPSTLAAVAAIVTGEADAAPALAQTLLPLTPQLWPALEAANAALATAARPVLIFAPALAPCLPADSRFGLFPVGHGPNATGAALVTNQSAPAYDDLAEDIEAGRVKALVVAEADLFTLAPRLAAALDRLETLIVCDHLPTPTVAAATVFLPSAPLFEAGGILCNNEGRLQRAMPVQSPGQPVSRDGGGDHPPRAYDRPLPGTDPRPAAGLFAALAEELALTLPDDPLAALAATIPALSGLDFTNLPAEGLRPAFPESPPQTPPAPSVVAPAGDGLTVVFDGALFGTEELGRYAPMSWMPDRTTPEIRLQTDDAAALGFTNETGVTLTVGDRPVAVIVRVSANMARGVVVVPSTPDFANLPPVLSPDALRRP